MTYTAIPHNPAYKNLFSNPEMVASFITLASKDVAGKLDFSTLKKYPSEFITYNLHERRSDMVWSVQLKNSDEKLYILLMLEFQSSVDYRMAARIAEYSLLLLHNLEKSKVIKGKEGYPHILPVVIYNGNTKWNAPTDLEKLYLPLPDEYSIFKMYDVRQNFLLIDESQFLDADLQKNSGLAAAFIRIEKSPSREETLKIVDEILEKWQSPAYRDVRCTIADWLAAVANISPAKNINPDKIDNLREVRYMLAENIALWREEDRRIGRAEGRAEGKAEGRIEGRAEERAENLEILCKRCKKLGLPTIQIIDILCEDYKLSETEANKIILKYTQ